MVIPPIPRYLLPHSCTLSEKLTDDGWGGGEQKETELHFVRIEPCRSQRFSLGGDIPEVSARLFYDTVNSFPQDISFKTGGKIIHRNREYTIIKAEEHYTSGEIHHMEVLLG